MSFIFRAYHAMARQRPMSTRTGLPTGATYVFVNMLRKLRQDFSPEYLAAIFDLSGPTFRDVQAGAISVVRKWDAKTQAFQEKKYEGYKANRAEMPGDLVQQLPYIRRSLDAYRIPILAAEGFEADDVIGTLALQAAAQDFEVFIVSSDKDMMQLVGPRVCVLNPTKDNLICDAAKVEELLGVPPNKVVDVMALRGDAIDNIPGAPGIGDKGSVQLIQQFGSAEAALDRAEEVTQKRYRESLQQNRDVVLLSKQLATIDTHVPVELNVAVMRAAAPDPDAARDLFTELEFTSLLKEFLPTGVEIGEKDYREATSPADIDSVLADARQHGLLAIAFDIALPTGDLEADTDSDESETGNEQRATASPGAPSFRREDNAQGNLGLGEAKGWVINACGLSAAPGSALTVDFSKFETRNLKLESDLPKAVHDSKTALRALRAQGIELNGVAHDPMLYSFLLDPTFSSHKLDEVALRRFNLKAEGGLAEAADLTLRFATALRKEVDEAGLTGVYTRIDLPLLPVLVRMEEAGVKLDSGVLAEMSTRLGRDADARAEAIYERAGERFNINSPKKLGEVLFTKMGLPKPIRHGKGRIVSTAADVLESLAVEHDVPRLVLQFRQLSKLKSTYVDALPLLCDRGGRLHTIFSPTGAVTGRLSSSNPNLQNIPIRTELGREIRAAFVADPGNVLLSADYSQIELRLLAHFSKDPLLVEAFRRGDDIHTLTASQVFGVPPLMIDAEHRRRAKAVNFGIVYGLSAFGLAQQIGIDRKEAQRFIDAYFEKYVGVRRFIDATLDEARREQRVRTLFGRVRPIPDINSRNPNMRGFAERTAVNTPLQGTAADLIKLAMIEIDRDLRDLSLRAKMLLQVHDELVFEVPEAELDRVRSLVKDRMEQVQPLRVPLVADLSSGPNWRDMD